MAHALMLASGALAFLFVMIVLGERAATITVAVAGADLEPGIVLADGDVRLVDLPAAAAAFEGLLPADAVRSAGPWTLRVPLVAGAPLREGDVAGPDVAGPRVLSFTLERGRAAGGRLAAGDRIDVIAVGERGAGYVAAALPVLAAEGEAAIGRSALTLSVAVEPSQALRLVEALEGDGVYLVRSTGAGPLDELAAGEPDG
jgi:Flp pilus assembly protein CpaB